MLQIHKTLVELLYVPVNKRASEEEACGSLGDDGKNEVLYGRGEGTNSDLNIDECWREGEDGEVRDSITSQCYGPRFSSLILATSEEVQSRSYGRGHSKEQAA